jgi:dolichol-phosphate mannosyltransferase
VPEKVVVAMPVFNEASGISEFLLEISYEFRDTNLTFVIIDDCSTDDIFEVILALRIQMSNQIVYERNNENMGHGASTLRAISLGLLEKPSVIITVDGDGQFYGKDLFQTFVLLNQNKDVDVVETIRKLRKDPYFRKVLSLITRLSVLVKSRSKTRDANSPLRAYRYEALQKIMTVLDDKTLMVPNIWISIFLRKERFRVLSIEVPFISRRGNDKESVTWKQKHRLLPSIRLVKFSLKAFKEVVSM